MVKKLLVVILLFISINIVLFDKKDVFAVQESDIQKNMLFNLLYNNNNLPDMYVVISLTDKNNLLSLKDIVNKKLYEKYNFYFIFYAKNTTDINFKIGSDLISQKSCIVNSDLQERVEKFNNLVNSLLKKQDTSNILFKNCIVDGQIAMNHHVELVNKLNITSKKLPYFFNKKCSLYGYQNFVKKMDSCL